MSFFKPQLLILLFLLVPVFLYGIYFIFRASNTLVSIFTERNQKTSVYKNIMLLRLFSLLLALASIIIALAGPQYGTVRKKRVVNSREIVFCFDISWSMLAKDVFPDRLEATKTFAKAILNSNIDARFALVVVKGSASVLVPLTEDREILESIIDTLHPLMLSAKGTKLEDGINESLLALGPKGTAERTIVYFSDGLEMTGSLIQSAQKLYESDVRLFTIGVGTKKGIVLDIGENRSKAHVVLSEDALIEASRITQGEYIALLDTDSLKKVVAFLSGKDTAFALSRNEEKESRAYLFLLVALIFLFIAYLLSLVPYGFSVSSSKNKFVKDMRTKN